MSTLLVIIAAFCWGISGGIGGILMARQWDPYVVSFYRGAIGLVCALLWLLFSPSGNGLANRRLWLWSSVAGVGVAGNFAFYFTSIAEGSLAVAATLMYCAPVFVYLVSFVLKLERPTPRKWVAVVMVLFGVVLLTRVHATGAGGVTTLGIGAGLLSGASYAGFIFGFKYAVPHGSPQAVLSIAFAVLVAVLAWPADPVQIVAVATSESRTLFAALGFLGAGLSFFLYTVGMKGTTPAVASVVAMVEPVTASLFGFAVLNQSLVGTQIIGMALILVTVTTLSASSGSGQEA